MHDKMCVSQVLVKCLVVNAKYMYVRQCTKMAM
jgi:hypothetical protein